MVGKFCKLENMSDLVSLCKRRGFLFQGSEVYGGIGGFWDYGPLGVEIKNSIRALWWKEMTFRRDVVGIDSAIIMNPKVWQASGHVDNFSDPMVDCKKCKSRFRSDALNVKAACPVCGEKNSFTDEKEFNLMFSTHVGPIADTSSEAYLRPETAQGIFVNFMNVAGTMRKKLPFGIAQTGKAFRNEITPGNFTFRSREFEQMEMQYFVAPGTQLEHVSLWKDRRIEWYKKLGLELDSQLRVTKHEKLAHYADMAFDIEFNYPNGFGELEGIHSRTDFDLKRHQEFSGKSFAYSDQLNNLKYIPYVVETSMGLDRAVLAVLCHAYTVEEVQNENRTVLFLPPELAPIKVAVLPLMKRPELEETAEKIFDAVSAHFAAEYDDSGSIGKRYRRQDEIGTPFCLTIDYESREDSCVTVRNRDTMGQERVSIERIVDVMKDLLPHS